jgi:RNA polymerase sigma-70 factor (sigma-E family)
MAAREAAHDSFTRWAGERQHALLRTALLVSGDRYRAEDLVQEALTKVALRWRTLEPGNPEAYARQIIVRDNISWWRKHRRETVSDVAEHLRPVPSVTNLADRRLLLHQALSRLTPRQRAVVVLRYYDDLTERETAEALGVTVGTVKSQTHLALRRMREAAPELAELLGEEAR